MMLRGLACAVAALSPGPALPLAGWDIAVQVALALAIALLAGVLNSRGLRALADLEIGLASRPGANRGWAGRPMVQWEVWSVACGTCIAVLVASTLAWQATVSWSAWDGGCSDWWRDRTAGVVAGIAAAAAVFVLLDDLRHHGVTLEPVAVCFGTAVLWRWLGAGFTDAGEAAVVGVIAGTIFALINAGLGVFKMAFGNGDWALFAAAGAWLGAEVNGWIVFLAVLTMISIAVGVGVRGRETPAGPAIIMATVAALVGG
jgi:prepilin signal peptidase PulO-like enzyme (type II secretory pathway)